MNSSFAGSFAPYVSSHFYPRTSNKPTKINSISSQTPPPDEQPLAARGHSPSQPSSSSGSRFTRPWFPAHNSSSSQQQVASSSYTAPSSYQSGAVPTWDTSAAGGIGSEDAEDQRNLWETRYNMRVDLLAAFAYLLGPVSGASLLSLSHIERCAVAHWPGRDMSIALALLIFETHNDYVRFHGTFHLLAKSFVIIH